jgi:hypothetical protein
MKLHAFETVVDESRFRAFTRDKRRRSLQKPIVANQGGIEIEPSEWVYHGIVSTTGIDNSYIRELHSTIRQNGFAVVRMPPLHTEFYVFDLELDLANLRIYSSDQNLKEFKKYRHRMELSSKGQIYEGGQEKYVGKVEIENQHVAKQMGIDDFDDLQRIGFWVVVVSTTNKEENMRRYLNRKLWEEAPKWDKELGIVTSNINVLSVEIKDAKNNEKPKPESPVTGSSAQNIYNNNSITNIPKDKTESEDIIKSLKKRGWVAFILIIFFIIVGIGSILESWESIKKFLLEIVPH